MRPRWPAAQLLQSGSRRSCPVDAPAVGSSQDGFPIARSRVTCLGVGFARLRAKHTAEVRHVGEMRSKSARHWGDLAQVRTETIRGSLQLWTCLALISIPAACSSTRWSSPTGR